MHFPFVIFSHFSFFFFFFFFQVDARESKKAAQKAAMVQKSISVTTLPRYAVNPTQSGRAADFQSLRGAPKAMADGPPKDTPKESDDEGAGPTVRVLPCARFVCLLISFFFLGKWHCVER